MLSTDWLTTHLRRLLPPFSERIISDASALAQLGFELSGDWQGVGHVWLVVLFDENDDCEKQPMR